MLLLKTLPLEDLIISVYPRLYSLTDLFIEVSIIDNSSFGAKFRNRPFGSRKIFYEARGGGGFFNFGESIGSLLERGLFTKSDNKDVNDSFFLYPIFGGINMRFCRVKYKNSTHFLSQTISKSKCKLVRLIGSFGRLNREGG